MSISVVINTLNEEKNIARAIKSVNWADEVVVCDMYSDDETVKIAKTMGAKIVFHKRLDYVEPARNFAISKASGDWILILDPDEEIPESLKERLIQIVDKMDQIDYVRIPRKNIIFDKWMKGAMWWPDLNIRFFRKGKVRWTDKIHRPPEVSGEGLDLPADEQFAILHHHYESISQFLERMIRYTKVQADEFIDEGYKFDWKDLIKKPLSEFLGRFFVNKGFQNGIHGLSLSILQAFSQFVLYLRIWEKEKFLDHNITKNEFIDQFRDAGNEVEYWMNEKFERSNFKKIFKMFKIL